MLSGFYFSLFIPSKSLERSTPIPKSCCFSLFSTLLPLLIHIFSFSSFSLLEYLNFFFWHLCNNPLLSAIFIIFKSYYILHNMLELRSHMHRTYLRAVFFFSNNINDPPDKKKKCLRLEIWPCTPCVCYCRCCCIIVRVRRRSGFAH